jgi:hypothetical protein
MVAPLAGDTKNTRLAGGAGAAAGALAGADEGGVSAPPQAAAITVNSPSITAFTILIAAPFRETKLEDYTLAASSSGR